MASRVNTLADFLALNKPAYLNALTTGKSKDWTVVIGNQAGDLDSAACSIAYSYLASMLFNKPTVALLHTNREDLNLRAENIHAYKLANLDPTHADLLCIDDIPNSLLSALSSSSFALVDHNRLATRFSHHSDGKIDHPRVVSIIDHHDDEGEHQDAEPRIIVAPVGSCSSLVVQYFKDTWTRETTIPSTGVANLLICAIMVDTDGLKQGGKAVALDRDAIDFLISRSTFTLSPPGAGTAIVAGEEYIGTLNDTLAQLKNSVNHLSTRDLLRRDYKEYDFGFPRGPADRVRVGIATVPMNPKDWFKKDRSPAIWEAMDEWMDEAGLDALGILCTYRSSKHKRQNIWIVKGDNVTLKQVLWEGLEANHELHLKRRDMGMEYMSKGMAFDLNGDVQTAKGSISRVWKQRNVKVTRKGVAPIVKNIIEGSSAL